MDRKLVVSKQLETFIEDIGEWPRKMLIETMKEATELLKSENEFQSDSNTVLCESASSLQTVQNAGGDHCHCIYGMWHNLGSELEFYYTKDGIMNWPKGETLVFNYCPYCGKKLVG